MAVTRAQVAHGKATLFLLNSPQKKKVQKSKPKPPKAETGPELNKKNGKIVRTGRQAIPIRPNTGLPKRRFPPVGSPTSKGLINTSNDCYKLAALQALFHTPAFYRYLGKIHKDCASQLSRCVLCATQDLLYQYWEEDDPKVRRARLNTFYAATKVKANLPTLAPDLGGNFVNNQQADSYDFLHYLVSEHIEPKDPVGFRRIFQMEFESTRTCRTCRTESVREFAQASFILQLPVNNPMGARSIWLHQCLRDFLGDGVQAWNCEEEGCDGPDRNVTTLLTHASEILVLRLAISTNAGQGGNNTKISANQTEVIYPEMLNLNQYVDHHQVREDCVYRLDGVVAHSGRNTNSGHYVAMVREYNNLRDFALINDEDVTTAMDWADMLRPTLRGKRIESYVLVYSKM
ncbi:Ubiquitin carboxyl-terminal hydrolase 17-like protein 13 [Pseudocercospora fuligena]|uniref:Ubiquitin carboxyl-terminal hydrolase 17-like protein 13 n=1 Tax=Pseudocercospora fuligena TaxID=685502 RepID=A0A8H6RCL8_9PEZI|nr:Ubiquitin carboxyl-terminal hydrolase 17-like protein 13 [Pseudocercospora fuligena]